MRKFSGVIEQKRRFTGYILRDGVVPIVPPDEPEVPDGAYLYGTPSESGNIGLRVGDTVTYYDGAVLPDINTVWTDEKKAVYPYAFIHEFNGDYHAYVLRISEGTQAVTGGGHSSVDFDNGEWYALKDNSTEWESSNSFGGHVLWANFDVLYNSAQGDLAGTLYLPVTEPIPVGEIVDYDGEIPIYEVIQ